MVAKHTIVLVQTTHSKNSRTFYDYETVNAAMDGICMMFEARLREMRPNQYNITYDVTDLYGYINQLGDLSCLTYDDRINAYVPYNKDWIKQRLVVHLRKQAGH